MSERCIHPTGCPYEAYRDGRCYAHDKVARGLLVLDDWGTDPATGKKRAPRQPLAFRGPREPRRHVLESAVVDDEQREIADLLEDLGAEPAQIKGALTRQRRSQVRLQANRKLLGF